MNPRPVPPRDQYRLRKVIVIGWLEYDEHGNIMPTANPAKMPTYRHTTCEHYADCLDHAADLGWYGFACGDCPLAKGDLLPVPPDDGNRMNASNRGVDHTCKVCEGREQ